MDVAVHSIKFVSFLIFISNHIFKVTFTLTTLICILSQTFAQSQQFKNSSPSHFSSFDQGSLNWKQNCFSPHRCGPTCPAFWAFFHPVPIVLSSSTYSSPVPWMAQRSNGLRTVCIWPSFDRPSKFNGVSHQLLLTLMETTTRLCSDVQLSGPEISLL